MTRKPECCLCAIFIPTYRVLPILLSIILYFLPFAGMSQQAEPMPVYVVDARVAPVIENLPLTGTITSEHSAALSPRVSGLVNKVNVDAGDRVSKGDVLVELDSVMAKLALNSAQAAVNESKVALQEAERLSNEARDLAKSKNIPETTVQARIADVAMKKAAVIQLEAEYKQQEEIVKRHNIIAPFQGVVSRKLTEAGEWVQTGTPVIDLVATNQLRLDVHAPQEYFRLINDKTPVIIKLDATPGKTFTGKVFATVPVNNPDTRTFLIRILIKGADDIIFPGMSAQAVFKVKLEQEALQLPRDAIIQYPDGRNTVWIITKKDDSFIASEQQIQIGRSVSGNVIIRKGINPGSVVVIRGNERLQQGQPVKILEQETTDSNN